MDLSDPYQAILLTFAAGTFLAAFFTRTAAVLFAWWASALATWFVFGVVPAEIGYTLDGVAAVFVGLVLMRSGRSTDALILLLFVFPLVVRLTADNDLDWRVSWVVGLMQMGLSIAGAWLKMAPEMRRRRKVRNRANCIRRGLRFAEC